MKIFKLTVFWTLLMVIFVSTSTLFAQDVEFNELSLAEIKTMSLFSDKINGSNNSSNQIPAGTIIVYKTNQGRYGKLLIRDCGYNLTFKWKTFNANGIIYSQGNNLIIRGTWSCDLDLGKESRTSRDFWWRQATAIERYIVPKDGARFALYRPVVETKDFKLIFGSARSNHVGSNADSQAMSISGLKGYSNATVILNGWHLDFHNGDKHINKIGLRLKNIQFNQNSGTLSWESNIYYADKNFDDMFLWTYWYVVIASKEGKWINGYKSGSDDGGEIILSNSLGSFSGQAQVAAILPQGWVFDYKSSDHCINELGVKYYNEFFNQVTRMLTWKTKLNYADKNFDDDYNYWVWYSALNSSKIVKILKQCNLRICNGGNCIKGESITIPAGYDYAAVFIRGWKFDYTRKDHHLNEVGVRIENQEFDLSSRVLSWNTVVDYADKNFDDEYKWQCEYTILGFRTADVDIQEHQPPMARVQPLKLKETIYVNMADSNDLSRDCDGDWLKDDLENELAEHFKPYYQFDTAENHRRSNEPVTIFQVRPYGCAIQPYSGTAKIFIKWAYLFVNDGGYGPDSYCRDSHSGDNASIIFILESKNNGVTWNLARIDKKTSDDYWLIWKEGGLMEIHKPYGRVRSCYGGLEVHERSHPVIYLSAHKHHEYLDNAYNHRDSLHSKWGCNDDVNGNGVLIKPDLHSNFRDSRFNNVGEPGCHSNSFFVNNLREFPGESAWGTDNFYSVKPNSEIWMRHFFVPLGTCR